MRKELLRENKLSFKASSEPELLRYYTKLSKNVFGVSDGFYPLGSCSMKYNPAINEKVASLSNFTELHPLQDTKQVQGSLKLMYDLIRRLCVLTGMSDGTLAPCAGAQGEYTGLKIIHAFNPKRKKILVPDSAHGTNPASASVNGFQVIQVKSNENGLVDIEDLREKLDSDVAGLMLTNPNTLGLYETNIKEISLLLHKNGSLMYYDGANFNALVGSAKVRESGFDVLHLNLHKTFSTPHGGGGPGSGPVLVRDDLVEFLPYRVVKKVSGNKETFSVQSDKKSIGRISMFYGNFLVAIKAYAYILSMGSDGFKEVSETSVLNARYLQKKLSSKFNSPYGSNACMHEFVLSLEDLKNKTTVSALDFAKMLLDYGIHAPTIYFPLIVHEALMIEPTETETLEVLDHFCDVMFEILDTCYKDPERLKKAPISTSVGRIDEVRAVKEPILSVFDEGNSL